MTEEREEIEKRETSITGLVWIIIVGIILAITAIIIFVPKGLIIASAISLILGIAGFHVVQKPQNWIIEFLGDYWTEWIPGPHILIPGLMKVRSKVSMATQFIELYMDEQNKLDFEDDSAPVRIRIKVRPSNAYLATYQVQISPEFKKKFAEGLQDWECAVEEQVDSAFRGICGGISIDKALKTTIQTMQMEENESISEQVKEIVNVSLEKWGIELEDVLLTDIELHPDTEKKRRELQQASKDIEIAEKKQKKTVIDQLAIGMGEYEKINKIATSLGLEPQQVLAYLLTNKLYDDLKTATIIATSEAGTLNAPINVAATMAAIQSQMDKGI